MLRFTSRRSLLLRSALGAGFVLTGLMGQPMAWAQAPWPDRPIRLVVPFAAGGNTDIVARLIAPDLAKLLGQPVLVDNKPGAGGNLAADAVAKAAPDGYTLLMGTVGTQAINPSIYRKISFGLEDFAPITLIASVPNVLVVNEKNPARTVSELVANGREHPLTFASSGAGSSIHLSGELFKSITKLDMTHVPYRGSALALTDLMGRQFDLIFDNLPTSLPHIQSGKLRALAVTSAMRTMQLPDVPTMIESGFPNFELGSWFGVLAPAGTPQPIIDKVDAGIQRIANQPAFEKRLVELGAQRLIKGPADFQAFIVSEHRKWGAVVKASGASLD
ncbi:Bug family tripartite tricarboxylate transporter substrate binding protein [Pseudorhodoferax sp.]|uniref:Bug family tripartite tricarboxylate transporter substrate binding protein n=1 Tax=Pseudorhodoferax sp. TaxID=1993553 RepID=UPI0039E42BDE